ncbi:MAG: hypothetical protein FLDDKLPJ_03274 [Phycisphaerae bacterium]|nr:hypothetical protein [Phycisphaerae bacterium]
MKIRNRLSLMSAGLVLAALVPAAKAAEYIEGVNDTLPVESGWTASGGNEIAYRWTAQNTFDLTEIRWHTSTINSGTIRLRVDTGGTPGAILREVNFNASGIGWHGAPFSQSYAVEAGQTYFVTFYSSNDYSNYLAEGGVHLTYYWTPNGQSNWNGPFDWAGHRMIQFYGDRDGGDCTGNETLKAKCRAKNCGAQAKGVMKNGQPGATVTFLLDGGQAQPQTVNANGRAKAKWCPAGSGSHTISVQECRVSATTDCP